MSLVETIPTNLTYNGSRSPEHMSTFDAWNILMNRANRTLNIASYYWTLRGFGNISGNTDHLVIINPLLMTASTFVDFNMFAGF